jgi:hypothetical protein
MAKISIGAATALVAFLVWQITGRLSPDALGMALGVLFGMLAGLPVALLVLAAAQRRPAPPRVEQQPDAYPHHPPVIVLTGDHYVPSQNRPKAQHAPLLPGQRRPHHPGTTLPDQDDGEDWWPDW